MLIQINEENDILLMYQMTEPCTKIIKHGLQSSFLTPGYSRIPGMSASYLALGILKHAMQICNSFHGLSHTAG